MQRATARNLPRETAILGLAEVTALIGLIYRIAFARRVPLVTQQVLGSAAPAADAPLDRERCANESPLSQDITSNKVLGALKRFCDIVLAACLLVLLLPLMAVTALAIKIDSPGPVFCRQQRVGRVDRTFTLLKFRSTNINAEAGATLRWAQKRDPRITRVGRVIRNTRVDELPQLANVILGEMSLVGPRPEPPDFVERLARAIPAYCQRTHVKPGLTGWAQVRCPRSAPVQDTREKLAYDLYYVKNCSIRLDMRILISTIRIALFPEGVH